jgi:4-amino-4-deoxy-L-arabinose transferase-like glycosyltransferase
LKVASSAGLFYALDPHLILYANHLLSETLFVFFCMVFFFFMVKAISKKPTNKKMWFAILAGLWLGMATLVKPISQFLPVIIVCFFAFAPTQIKKGLKLSGVFILVFVLVTFPWLLRNYLTFDVLSISSSSDYNLLLLHVASFETDRRGVQDKQIAQTILRNEANEMMRADGLDPNSMHPYGFVPTSYYRQLAMQYIKQYPACFAKHYIAGLLHLFLELDTPNYARYLHIPITTFHTKGHANIFELMIEWFRQKTTAEMSIGIFVITYLVICYVAVAVGIFTSIKNKDYHCIFLLLCAVGRTPFNRENRARGAI